MGRKALPWCTEPAHARSGVGVERLSADDQLILWPDEVWPQDIGALGVLDGTGLLDSDGCFRIEIAKQAVEGRLHLLPRFRQVLYIPRRGLGGPLWVDAPAFDLSDHVRVERLHAPADEATLPRAVEQLRRRRLDKSRPLWEMWFLTGLPHQRIGLFVRLHHVVADGIAGVAELGALLDTTPSSAMALAQPWIPEPWPSARHLLRDNVERRIAKLGSGLRKVISHPASILGPAHAAMPAVRELLADKPGPQTSLNRVIGQDRTLALVRSNLELVNEVAHTHGAKVNDVLLAMIAGGLRGLLWNRDEPIEGVILPIYVPVSLRRERSGVGGNLISQMVVHLPLGIADPSRRLRQIALETAERKAIGRPSLGTMFHSKLIRGAMLKLIVRQRVNVVSADLPGPQAPLYFAGARLIEVFPLLNLLGTESIGVGALSYAGQFNIMAVADADAYPDIEVFAGSARDDLRALADATARLRG